MRRTISLSLALLLMTGSLAAFACDSYCAPAQSPIASETAASEHDAHAHHHAATPAPRATGTDAILAAPAGHPPQCSMSAETPRIPRVVRSSQDAAAAVTVQTNATLPILAAASSSALAPSPPPSPPHQHVLPLRI